MYQRELAAENAAGAPSVTNFANNFAGLALPPPGALDGLPLA